MRRKALHRSSSSRHSSSTHANPIGGVAVEVLESRKLLTTVVVNSVADTDSAGLTTLRDAISIANSSTTPTLITFDATVFANNETITLSGSQLELTNTSEPTTIVGTGSASTPALTISGNGRSRIFYVDSGVSLSVSEISATGCDPSDHDGDGGAFYVAGGGSLTLSDATVGNNTGAEGSHGGGLANYGKTALNNVSFTANSAYATGDATGQGGAIYNNGTLVFNTGSVDNNYSQEGGGGICSFGGNITLTNVGFDSNSGASANSTDNGGGLEVAGTNASLTDDTFSNNTANGGFGGGIADIAGSTCAIVNVTLVGNTAGNGAGIYLDAAATLIGDTITGNVAQDSGGGILDDAGKSALIGNTIVAGNTLPNSDKSGPDVEGAAESRGNNLVGKTDGSSGWLTTDLTGTIASALAPDLGAVASNGGPTQTQLPLTGSPAIAAGSVALIPSGVTTDQRGYARTYQGTVDIGAVEAESVSAVSGSSPRAVVVNSTSDTATGAGVVTLRDAIATANSSTTPTTITFDPTVFATAQAIVLDGTELELTNTAEPTTITGPAAGVTVSGAGTSRIVLINTDVTASMQSLNITDGDSGESGGGIDNSGTLTMLDVTISGNTASGFGGGVANEGGTMTLENSVVSGNSTTGASAKGGGVYNDGALTVSDSTVDGNSTPSYGGGIDTETGELVLVNDTISGNNAGGVGGVNDGSGTALMEDVTIAGNTTVGGVFNGSTDPGGVASDTPQGAVVTIANSIIAGNSNTINDDYPDAAGTFASLGNNLIGATDGSNGWLSSDFTGTAASPLAANLGPLANNGGPTETLLPAADSLVISHGSVALIPSGITTDQRGDPRTVNGAVDIGAVEVGGPAATTAASVTTLAASAHTLVVGQADTFTVAVGPASGAGPTATGSVSIYQDGSLTGTYDLGANGQVAAPITASSQAANTVYTAVYSGHSDFASSTSGSVTQTYLPASAAVSSIARAVVPASAIGGQKFTARVPVAVTNTGTVLTGNFTFVLYLDGPSVGLDTAPIQIGGLVRRVSLKTRKSFSVSLTTRTLPASVPAGTYHLVAEMTDPVGNFDLVTTNQTVTVATPFVSLSAAASAVHPATIMAGKSGALVVTVTNHGNINAAGLLVLTLSPSFDGISPVAGVTLITTMVHATIKPGKSGRYTLHFKIPATLASGVYFPYSTVSFDGTVVTAIGSVPFNG